MIDRQHIDQTFFFSVVPGYTSKNSLSLTSDRVLLALEFYFVLGMKKIVLGILFSSIRKILFIGNLA